MKKTIYTLLGLLLAAGLTSCQDWFIEKPEVTGMDQDEVFSTAKNAEGAIAEAYATILSSGLPVLVWNNSPIMPYETTEAIMGGEDLCRLTWGYMDKQVVAGMLANNENNGAGYTDDYFPNNYAYIRKAWLVYENIDKVADMSDRDKAIVKVVEWPDKDAFDGYCNAPPLADLHAHRAQCENPEWHAHGPLCGQIGRAHV